MSFTFDEETHTYRLGGEVLPSVTQIIKPLYDFSSVPAGVLGRAAAFGTAVHKTVELYLKDDLDEASLDPGLVGPLEGFKKWLKDNPFILHDGYVVEHRMYHRKHKFAGTADLIIDKQVIVDIKTRPANPCTDSVQLAAYEMMWTNEHGSDRYDHRILELKQDGTYNYTTVKRPGTREKFRFLLDYYRAGQKIAIWRNHK